MAPSCLPRLGEVLELWVFFKSQLISLLLVLGHHESTLGYSLTQLGEVGGGFHGNSKHLCALRGGNDTAVTEGLFLEILMLLYQGIFCPIEFLVPLDGTKVSSR